MAVQKSKKSRSRRGMRRSHDKIEGAALTVDQITGEVHRRHHVAADGYYKGVEVISKADNLTDDSE